MATGARSYDPEAIRPLRAQFGERERRSGRPWLRGKAAAGDEPSERNCDRATALARTLSAQLREAQSRINQLEREADGLVERLRAEAEDAAKLGSDANARSSGRRERRTRASLEWRARPRAVSFNCGLTPKPASSRRRERRTRASLR